MASLTFRVKDSLKQRFDALVDELGLNRSHVLRAAIGDKLAELETLAGLKRGQQRDPLPAVLEQARRCPEVRRVILFGSRAVGDHTARSDVDVALSCPGIAESAWAAIVASLQEAETLKPIDVVWLEQVDPTLKEEIERSGKVVYERA